MVTLQPSQRAEPLSVQISREIRSHIATGEWTIGDRIPGEHELVAALGASRSTVREALHALIHSGLLEARPGDGTYVRATDELDVVLKRQAQAEDALTVFEVREALELQGARLAASRASADEIDALSELLDHRDRATTAAAHLEFDNRFHVALVDAAGNALLARLYRTLDRAATYPTNDAQRRASADRWPEADPHREVVAALRAADPDAAAAAVSGLIEHARAVFLAVGVTDGAP